jgi:hypothetical protein
VALLRLPPRVHPAPPLPLRRVLRFTSRWKAMARRKATTSRFDPDQVFIKIHFN